MLKYLKAAFKNRWNLLALMAGTGVAILSSRPAIIFPLVLAAEAAYLALVGGNSQFQKYIDTEQYLATRSIRSRKNRHTLQRMLRSMPRELRDRYHQLRERCQELQGIAADLKPDEQNDLDQSLESMQMQSLDRLLWIYLRLLFTYNSLQRFLNKTSLQRIKSDIQRIESRLALIDPEDTSPHKQKLRRTLRDNLATSQDRVANYERARANHEFVELEIDRLENKIKSLSEIAVNRQEPDYVSTQVDQVANSMLETERTMNDLKVFTGLGDLDEFIPPLLEANLQRQRE